MPREKVMGSDDQRRPASTGEPQEEGFVWNLRPRALAEYVGQKAIVDNLRIAITAATKRG